MFYGMHVRVHILGIGAVSDLRERSHDTTKLMLLATFTACTQALCVMWTHSRLNTSLAIVLKYS